MKIINKAKCFLHLGFDETDATHTSVGGWLVDRTRPFIGPNALKYRLLQTTNHLIARLLSQKSQLCMVMSYACCQGIYPTQIIHIEHLTQMQWVGYLASTQRKPRIEHNTSQPNSRVRISTMLTS